MNIRLALIVAVFMTLLLTCSAYASREKDSLSPLPDSKKDCTNCHANPATNGPGVLKKPLSTLCLDCHPERSSPRDHKLDVTPLVNKENLPLLHGMMTCITCHDPHGSQNDKLLRLAPDKLCHGCHDL